MFEETNRQTAELMAMMGQSPTAGTRPRVGPATSNVPTGVPLKEAPGGFSTVPDDYGFVGDEPNFPETGSVAPSLDTKFYKMKSGLEGQMSVDPTKPSRVIKSARLDTPEKVRSLRQGLPGALFQVDHILPLWGGGTNNDENKQVLTNSQHLQKTRVEDVARSMYYAGKVSLPQALTVAMNWKDKDIKGIQVDDQDNVDLNLAQQKWDEWQQDLVKPKKVGIREWWNSLTSKEFREGEDIAAMMPDNPLGEFGKGLLSGASLGYIKSKHEDYEGADSFASTVAGVAGQVLGMLPSFVLGGAAVRLGAEVAAPLALGTRTGEVLSQIAGRAPSAAFKISPKVARVIGSSATFSLVGQASAQNENSSRVERLLKDMGTGVVFGAVSPSVLGSFQAMAATYVLAAAEGAGVKDSLANALVVGVLHAGGALGGGTKTEALSGETKPGEPVEKALSRTVTQEAVKFRQDMGIEQLRFKEDGTPFLTAEDAAHNYVKDLAKLQEAAGIKDTNSLTEEQVDVFQQLSLQHKFFTRELVKNGMEPGEQAQAHWEDFMSVSDAAERLSEDTFSGVPSKVRQPILKLDKVAGIEQGLPPELVQKLPSKLQPIVTEEMQFLPTGQGHNSKIKNNLRKFLTKENVVDNPLKVVGVLRSEPEFSVHIDAIRAQSGKSPRMKPEANVEWYIIDRDRIPHSIGFSPDITTAIKQNAKYREVEAPETDLHANRENHAEAMKALGIDVVQGELVATPSIIKGELVGGTHTNVGIKSGTEFARIRIRPQHWNMAVEMTKLPKERDPNVFEDWLAPEVEIEKTEMQKAFQVEGAGPFGGIFAGATERLGEALKTHNPVEVQKSFLQDFGLELDLADTKKIMASSGKMTFGDVITMLAADVTSGTNTRIGESLLNAFKTIPQEGREQVWNISVLDKQLSTPKVPVQETISKVTKEFKQPDMVQDADKTWWIENPSKTGIWADFVKQGHKVEWNLKEKPSGKNNYSDYLNRVRIDGKVMSKDEAFRLVKGQGTPANVASQAKENTNFRKVLKTDETSQTVAMSIPKGSDIGAETHQNVKQTITVQSGKGEAITDGKKTPLKEGDTIVVEPKTEHNIVNKGEQPLKLSTVYEPPNHPEGTVHKTKAEAKADKVDEAFGKKVSVIPLKPKPVVPKEWKTASTVAPDKELSPEAKSGPVTFGATEGLKPGTKKFTFYKDNKPEAQKADIPDTQSYKLKGKWTSVPDPKNPERSTLKWISAEPERPDFHAGIQKTPVTELVKLVNKELPDNWSKMTDGHKRNWIEEQLSERIKAGEKIISEEVAPGVDSLEREIRPDEGVEPAPPGMDEVIGLMREGELGQLADLYQKILRLEKDPITTISEKWMKLKPMIHNRFVKAIDKGEVDRYEVAKQLTLPGESVGDTMLALTEPIGGAEKVLYGINKPISLGQDLAAALSKTSKGDKTFPYVLREILSSAKDKEKGVTMLEDPAVLKFMESPKFKKTMYGDEGRSSGEYVKTIALLAKLDPKLSSKDRQMALHRIYDYSRTKKSELAQTQKKAYKNLSEKDMLEKDLIENKIHQTEVLENYLKDVTEFDKLGPKKLAKSLVPLFRTMAENEPVKKFSDAMTKMADSFEKITDKEAGAELATGFALKLIPMVNAELGTKYSAPNATRFKLGVSKSEMDKTISDIVSRTKKRTPESILQGEKIFKSMKPEQRKAWLEENPWANPDQDGLIENKNLLK